jgi:hypothetical protein
MGFQDSYTDMPLPLVCIKAYGIIYKTSVVSHVMLRKIGFQLSAVGYQENSAQPQAVPIADS